jgi:hypothetical protein
VKQSDLGEYEENAREKQNIQYTKQKHQLPLKPSHMDGKHQFSTQEGSNQNTRFLNVKDHTPPEAKANHKLPLKPWQSNQAPNLTKDANSP